MKRMVSPLVLVLVFIFGELFAQSLPEKIIVGYWHNWGYTPNTVFLRDIPEEYDVINVAFATPTEILGANMQFLPDPGIYPNEQTFIDEVATLKGMGKKVVISIGGANDPISLLDEDDIQTFVSSMSTIIDTYGFDGVDIDLENGSIILDSGDNDFRAPTTQRIVNLIEAFTQLLELYPNMILSAAPETAYVQGAYSSYGSIWGAYLPLLHALHEKWTYIHVQHYNTGSMYGADGAIYTPATADFHVAMADMLIAGFNVNAAGTTIFFEPLSPEQIVIGLPASSSAAGSGYTAPIAVKNALDYLIFGTPFGGEYQLSNSDGYRDFRGVMTWSINWDIANNLEFATSYREYFDNLTDIHSDTELMKYNIFAYPNPFNPNTTIMFDLLSNSKVSLEIYNIMGKKVKTLINNKEMNAGANNQITWDGKDKNGNSVASSVYFYRIKIDNKVLMNKVLLLK